MCNNVVRFIFYCYDLQGKNFFLVVDFRNILEKFNIKENLINVYNLNKF